MGAAPMTNNQIKRVEQVKGRGFGPQNLLQDRVTQPTQKSFSARSNSELRELAHLGKPE